MNILTKIKNKAKRSFTKEIICAVDMSKVNVDVLSRISSGKYLIWFVPVRGMSEPLMFFDLDRLGLSNVEMEKLKKYILEELGLGD